MSRFANIFSVVEIHSTIVFAHNILKVLQWGSVHVFNSVVYQKNVTCIFVLRLNIFVNTNCAVIVAHLFSSCHLDSHLRIIILMACDSCNMFDQFD